MNHVPKSVIACVLVHLVSCSTSPKVAPPTTATDSPNKSSYSSSSRPSHHSSRGDYRYCDAQRAVDRQNAFMQGHRRKMNRLYREATKDMLDDRDPCHYR